MLFKLNEFQTAIPGVEPVGMGLGTRCFARMDFKFQFPRLDQWAWEQRPTFFRQNEFQISSSMAGPVDMGAKTYFLFARMNFKFQFPRLGQWAWEQRHAFFRQIEFQISISKAGPVGVGAKTFFFSPE